LQSASYSFLMCSLTPSINLTNVMEDVTCKSVDVNEKNVLLYIFLIQQVNCEKFNLNFISSCRMLLSTLISLKNVINWFIFYDRLAMRMEMQ
jgi:hypothetical protein